MELLKQLICIFTNRPYFEVRVLSNGRKVKKFIQDATGKQNGEDFFLMCESLKMAWSKPETPIIDGLKFLVFVELVNAYPLIIKEEVVNESNNYIIKETKIKKISIDNEKLLKTTATGKPVELVEIALPPTILYEKVQANFIKKILSPEEDQNKWLIWIIIAAIAILVIYLYFNMTGASPI